MFCPKCGSKNEDDAAFCGNCGNNLNAPKDAPTIANAASEGVVAGGSTAAEIGGGSAAVAASKMGKGKVFAVAVVAVIVVAIVAVLCMNLPGGVSPKGSVNDYSWEELSKISAEIASADNEAAAIEVAKKYNLCTPDGKLDGTQEKLLKLTDGTETAIQICGFVHDDKSEGGKAGITFIFKDCITNREMNSIDTNAGGWEDSQMRSYLNFDGLSLLPDELKSYVLTVKKSTNNVGSTQSTSCVTFTDDALWLFSLSELFGNVPRDKYPTGYESYSDIVNMEGSKYKLFSDLNTGVNANENGILMKGLNESESSWWMRSPYQYSWRYSGDFCEVSAKGYEAGGSDADTDKGVVPGFCI